jgi:transposase-like protein
VWPETIEQRCWVHKVANCLNALPKSVQPTARKLLGPCQGVCVRGSPT